MKLYLLEQISVTGYDTYDSCVVCALNEDIAKSIYPGGSNWDTEGQRDWPQKENRITQVTATYLGEAVDCEQGVICASFNAG